MDISIYSLQDLLLAALKSEVDSQKVYSGVARQVENFMLKDRFEFLASEENKHHKIFTAIWKERYPSEKIILPDKSPVPLPEIVFEENKTSISSVIDQAMKAEMAAYDFYNALSEKFREEPPVKHMLAYVANMEIGHYKLLETEKEAMANLEDADITWPNIHLGP